MVKLLKGPYQSTIRRFWRWALFGLGAFVVYLLAVYVNLFSLFGGMPSLKALENPRNELASEIISADNVVLGTYFVENRSPVELNQVSTNVVKALIATEDARFTKHSGIDPRSIFRSVVGVLTFNTSSGGGSTLTQQLVKNLFEARSEQYQGALGNIPGLRMLIVKTKEWITAIQIERRYTKQEIMQMYLNTVSFGSNAYGIRIASRTYFNKEPAQLEIEEAAVLVGMLKNPTAYNPKFHPVASRNRRNVVFGQMARYGFLDRTGAERLMAKPLVLKYRVQNQNTNKAAYFITVIKDRLIKELAELNRTRSEDEQLDLYTSGLKIRVTLDSRMQAHAEEAVREQMREQQRLFDEHWKGHGNPWRYENGREIPNFIENAAKRTERYRLLKAAYGADSDSIRYALNRPVRMRVFTYDNEKMEKDTTLTPLDSIRYYKRFLNAGFMAMNPNTGHVKAWVGGVNFKYFKFDHVKQSRRQPGSSFKPFTYATALDNGYTPCDRVADVPVCIGDWCPKNSTGKYSGAGLTLRQALGRSVNSVVVHLMKKFGSEKVVEYAHRIGIKSPIPNDVTICLGTPDVSVHEMVNSYSTFVNKGTAWNEPLVVTSIEDRYGNTLRKLEPTTRDALSPETAYRMVQLLRGSVQEPGGTAQRINREPCGQNNEIGGKTGTTSNHSDGWFMGITQNLVAGVWVGGDDRSIHFRSLALGQGGRMAMPAWTKFMNKVYADPTIGLQKVPFEKPADATDCSSFNFGGGDSLMVMPTNNQPPPDLLE
jgi:penicillin-binding protein 1A